MNGHCIHSCRLSDSILAERSVLLIAKNSVFLLSDYTMLRLNVKQEQSSFKENPKFELLMQIAGDKQLSDQEELYLLNEIRNGNRELIDKLVESSEVVILEVIGQNQPDHENLEQVIEAAKSVLRKMAENEINSSTRERFFRFRAWYVKQAVLSTIKA